VGIKRVLLYSSDFEEDADLEKDAKKTRCTWEQQERFAHNREAGKTYVPVRRIDIRKKRLFFL
jgi:hypothetical protein